MLQDSERNSTRIKHPREFACEHIRRKPSRVQGRSRSSSRTTLRLSCHSGSEMAQHGLWIYKSGHEHCGVQSKTPNRTSQLFLRQMCAPRDSRSHHSICCGTRIHVSQRDCRTLSKIVLTRQGIKIDGAGIVR